MRNDQRRISRRGFAGMLVGSGAAARLAAQTAREQELETARKRRLANAATLAKFDLPMATEPAFVFRP